MYSINDTSISVMSASLSVPSRVPTCAERMSEVVVIKGRAEIARKDERDD